MSADPANLPTLVPLAEMPILLLTGGANLMRHDGPGERCKAQHGTQPRHCTLANSSQTSEYSSTASTSQ